MKAKLAVAIVLSLFLTITSSTHACYPSHPRPIASASANPTEVFVNESVSFSSDGSYARCSGSITAYLWDFGDGEGSSDLENPSYAYFFPGDFDAKLKVRCNHWYWSAYNDTDTVTVAACNVHNLTQGRSYGYIQDAIDEANNFDVIEVGTGTFRENIDFNGVNCTLRSIKPNDPCVVEATIIDGNDSGGVVTFNSGEDENAVLKGLTIRNAGTYGITCSGTSPVITDCIIEDSGTYGIYLESSAAPVIERNKIRGNATGIFIAYSDGSVSIKNNWIYNNSDKGIEDMYSSNITIYNNTIVDNFIGIWAVGTYTQPTIGNCIIWYNNYQHSGCDATYSCIEGWGWGTNISSDPCFVDYANDDFHLTSDSLCIDAGNPNLSYDNEVDIDGDQRKFRDEVDIGADEWHTILYVDDDANPGGDGHSWATAFDTIQEGINAAVDGYMVVVAEGTYYQNIDFNDKRITLTSTDSNNPNVVNATIIKANDINDSVVTFNDSEDVNAIIKGFVITGGSRGIDCDGTSPIISNCIIISNGDANSLGGGIYDCNGATPLITNCFIVDNDANYGGGIYNCNGASPLITNCFIVDNDANYGAGIYNEDSEAIIRNCVISKNLANEDGGGIYNEDSSPFITNCTITDNNAFNGGGMFNTGSLSEPNIVNCILWGNNASGDGNEVYNSTSPAAAPNFSYCDIRGCGGSNWVSSFGNDGGGNIDQDPLFKLAQDVIEGLISHWKFDEDDGDTAYDSAGNNDGTIYGAQWTTGQIDGALDFDGSDDYVSIPDDESLDITGDITISAWVYFDRGGTGSDGSEQVIVAKTVGGGAYNNPFDFRTGTGPEPSLRLIRADASGHEWVYSTQPFSIQQWHHVTVTVNNNGANFYVDGVVTSKTGGLTKPASGNSKPVCIGRRDNGLYLDGKIDDVRIYDRALDANEVRKLFEIRELFEYYLIEQYKYHLDDNSSCINTGDPNSDSNEVGLYDIDSEARIQWGRVEIGADEVDRDEGDSDGDSMLNWWEEMYGLNPNKFDAYDDLDGDGYANITEYEFGSDPSNAGSVPVGVVAVEPNETVNSLQQAINSAGDGNTVILMPGIYKSPSVVADWPTADEWTNFLIDDNDITLRSVNPLDPDIVASTILTSVEYNGKPIISLYLKDNNSLVQGLTLTGSSLAIRCISNDPVTMVSKPTILDCRFVENKQEDQSPHSPSYRNGAYGASGLGITDSAPTVKRCTFINNTGNNGGAITIWNDANDVANLENDWVEIEGCIFTENIADRDGGGAIYWYASSVDIQNCYFSSNIADVGGAVYALVNSGVKLGNCVLSSNRAISAGTYDGGGACAVKGCSLVEFRNCTMTGNTASKGGALYVSTENVDIFNTILWDNIADNDGNEVYAAGGPMLTVNIGFRFCDVKGGVDGSNISGYDFVVDNNGGNIDVDPCFVLPQNPAGFDGLFGTDDDGLRLHPAGPCVDKGDNSEAPEDGFGDVANALGQPVVDIPFVGDGAPATRDIGAYERQKPVLFVKEGASGTEGLSWDDAYGYLQDALGRTSQYDLNELELEIWVAEGTYYPDEGTAGHTADDRTETFQLISNVELYGSFAGDETYRWSRDIQAYETILSGDIKTPGDADDNSYHVVTGADNAIIDGFTITKGNADGSVSTHYLYGGGIYNYQASPAISNCLIEENHAGLGGGIYNWESSPQIANTVFKKNTAIGWGGAIVNKVESHLTITDCLFRENSALSGGAVFDDVDCSTNLVACIFEKNVADPGTGGALYANASCRESVLSCVFAENHSEEHGGAIAILGGKITIQNSVLISNSAGGGPMIEFGGGVYNCGSLEMVNCTVVGNSAEYKGGGLYNSSNGTSELSNCILWGNSAANSGDEIYNSGTSGTTLLCCDVNGSGGSGDDWDTALGTDGGGNFDINPLFVDPCNPVGPDGKWFTDDDGLRLMVFDPRIAGQEVYDGSCIDSADMDAAPETDICGRSRIDVPYIPNADDEPGQYADMGAYEMPTVWYVNAYNVYPGIGSSWWYAMNNLQEAISKAKDGEEIWVAEGEYKPGAERSDTFYMDKGIKLYGGFGGYEYAKHERDWNQHMSILSGNIGEIIDHEDNSYQVVNIDSADVVLDGFVIEYGYGYESDGRIDFSGAGIYMQNSSSAISNCVLRYNYTGEYGSAMYINGGAPTIANCSFVANYEQDDHRSFPSPIYCSDKGGGIYAEKASPVIKDCLFARNAADDGGAIFSYDSTPVVANCVFHQNTTTSWGEAVYFDWSVLVLEGSCFLMNCLFAGNEGDCGVYVNPADDYAALVLSNCTFTHNTGKALYFRRGTYADIMNCIFFFRDENIYFNEPKLVKVRNSDIEGGCPPGVIDGGGNIDVQPDFVELPKFHDTAMAEYFIDVDGDAYPESGVLWVADASKYSIGDVIQYEGDPNARTVIGVDLIRNEVIFTPPYYEGTAVHTERDKQVTFFDSFGNPTPDITTGEESYAVDFFVVGDTSKYHHGGWIEYNNDGILRQIIGLIEEYRWIYFSPSLIEGYRADVNITNWGRYAITNYNDSDRVFKVTGKVGRLKVAAAGSSPCIDKGSDLCVPADFADLDNDGQDVEEKTPYDIMGVPRLQEIFSDSDANSVDMGAFESGGLVSADQTISVVIEDDPCTFDLDIQDLKGGSVTYVIVTEPKHGSLTTTSGIQITYTPDAEYVAAANADEFYYKPFDGTNYGELTEVTIQAVSEVSDPPVAVNDVAWLDEGGSEIITISVIKNDYDPDTNTPLTVVTPLPQDSIYGDETAVDVNTKIQYQLTDSVGFFAAGSDSFTYKCQNTQQSNPGTVTVNANYRPCKDNDLSVSTELEIAAVIDAVSNYSDENTGQTLQAATIVQQPDKGQAVIYEQNPRYIIYIPDAEATTSYTTAFTYKVEDELELVCNDANIATVQVTVNATETITDTDQDWIADSDETDILGTDPHNPDSDGDNVDDLQEIAEGFDPTNPYISGYYADPLPYAACFFPSQRYTVEESLDGQQGWQVEDGNCVLQYEYLDWDPVSGWWGCICATMDPCGSGTIVSKGLEDNGVADGDSNTIVVKLYPVEGAEVRVISDGTTIAGIKFVDTGQKRIQYYNQGWQTSSVSWNYDWANGNPDNPSFSLDYEEHNYALVVKFVTDFSKSSEQCQIFWDSSSDDEINWTSVGPASFSSSIKSISKIELRSGTNHAFRVRGLYVSEVLDPSCKITYPEQQSFAQSRIPVKGWCYGTNMSGYRLFLYSVEADFVAEFSRETGITGRLPDLSDPNGEILGYWNSGMWPNGSYYLGLFSTPDLCWSSYAAIGIMGNNRGVDYDDVEDVASCGSIKNSVFHHVEEPDISIPWHGEFPFELRRIYNSGRRNVTYPFFPGWTNNLQVTLTEYADYYESSTCEKKVGGEIADKDKADLAFGAIYVQYENSSIRLFRHMTGSVDSYESIYVPYPDDNSGSYIKRIVTGDVNEFVDYCPDNDDGDVVGDGFSVDYVLHRADGTKITFSTVEDIVAVRVPDDANYYSSGEGKEYPYYPYGGAVYRELSDGDYCDGSRLVFYEPQGEETEKWRISTLIETKTDKLGNTLYYGWDYYGYYGYNCAYGDDDYVCPTYVSTSPDGPNATSGITISFDDPYVVQPNFYYYIYRVYYQSAKLIVDCNVEQTVHYEHGYDEYGTHLFLEVYTEDKDANESGYKSYAYGDRSSGYLRGIFNGKVPGSFMDKCWDWPKRTTLIGYDSQGNFAERIDYVDTEKDEGNYKMYLPWYRWYLAGQDFIYTSGSGGETYFPITQGDNYLYRYYWWFFIEPDSGNDEDGQGVFNVTNYYRPEDYVPYRTDYTIVNEKGQLRTQGNMCLLNNLWIPKVTTYNYGNVDLPYTPNEVTDTWLDYNCISNDYELAGKRIANEYEKSRILPFGPNNPTIEMYDLVRQDVYDSNEDVNTTPAGQLDDYLVGYTENVYHDYGGFNFQTETLSYQQLDKQADPLSHEKPIRTEYVYGLHDGTISGNDACNVYVVQEIVLLNENDPGPGDDDEKTTYYEYYHSTDPGPDGIPDNEDDAYALTKIINCCGGGVTLYEYDTNHRKKWVKVGTDEASAVPTERYCYDTLGQLLLKADTYGLVTRYDYDGFGAVVKVRTYHDAVVLNPQVRSSFEPTVYDEPLPSGVSLRSVTIYEYDEQGRRISERSFSAETKGATSDDLVCTSIIRTDYLVSNRANKVINGEITHFDGSEPNITDHSVFEYGYDGRGLKIWEKTLDELTGLWWYTDYYYNSLNQVIGTIWTDYEDRDILRAMSRQYHGSGKEAYEILFGAGADGSWQVQKVTDFKYDVLDRMVQRTDSIEVSEGYLPIQSATTSYYYDDVGNQTCVKDPLGNCNFIDYDNANRKIREYFAEPFDTDLAWTKSCALIKKELGYYDTGLVKDINSYDYELEGGGAPVPPGLGKLLSRTEFTYDARSRVTDVNQAVNTSGGQVTSRAHTQYTYEDANNGTLVDGRKYAYAVVTDANSKQTTIVYNEKAAPIKTIFPSSQYQQSEFNGDGTLKKKSVFNQADQLRWIEYSYDHFKRLETVTYPEGSGTLNYTYDGLGRNTEIVDGRSTNDNIGGSGKIYYEYNPLGQITAITEQDGYRTDYSHRADGQKQSIKVTEPGDLSAILYEVNYDFDVAGRLVAVFEPELVYGYQSVAGLDYDDNGNRSELTYYLDGQSSGDKVSILYSYNYDNLLTGFNTSASGVTAPTFKLENVTVDGRGRLTDANETLTKTNGSQVVHSLDYGYDCLSQLTDATISNIGGMMWSSDYVYQKNGDMNSRTINAGATTSFDYIGNQMDIASGGEVFDLDYDKNGNLKVGYAASSSFTYNWDNRLRSAIVDTKEMSLRYDPQGNRIYKSSSVKGDRKYIVDIVGDLPVILLELDAADHTIKKAYIYANSQIVAQYDGDWRMPLDCKHFYLHDRLGSVRQIIDCQADIVKLYTYNPFGEIIEEEGSFDNSFMFTGQWYDDEIGQYYLRARMYDPHLGRFTGRDPAEGCFKEPLTLHKYLYCLNDPINHTDLTGRVVEGISTYYTLLYQLLLDVDDWWDVLDAAIAVNTWREAYFRDLDPAKGLFDLAEQYVSTRDQAIGFLESNFRRAYNYFDQLCDWSGLGICLGFEAVEFGVGETAGLVLDGLGWSACLACISPEPVVSKILGCTGCAVYLTYKGYSFATMIRDVKNCFETECGHD